MSKVTYGFEFEIFNMSTDEIADAVSENTDLPVLNDGYTHDSCQIWKSVRDGSCGSELVSRILDKGGFTEIGKALKAVKIEGAKIDRSCGLHVHIGSKHDDGTPFIQNVGLLYTNWYAVHSATNGLVSPSRINNHYAMPKNRAETFVVARDVYAWVDARHWRDEDRYFSLNVLPLKKFPTVEFRLHQGTLNPTKAIAWADFCEAFIHLSNAGVDLESLDLGIRSFKGSIKDDLSKIEAKILIKYMVENGFLSASAGHYLITSKI